MNEHDFIQGVRENNPRETWVEMMRARRALQTEGKTSEEIVTNLSATYNAG